MKRIWWLASYPKSGNTWMRAFLTSLLSGRAVDINDMSVLGGGIASARELIDQHLGLESGDLTEEQQADIRPLAYQSLNAERTEPLYLKVHDGYGLTPSGQPLLPPSVSAGAVYIVRNPLDVAVSAKYYFGCSIDGAVAKLLKPDLRLRSGSTGCLSDQLTQTLGHWASHVESWLGAPFPVHLVRFEDLLHSPQESFTAVARFLGRPEPDSEIARAVHDSCFDNLRRQEVEAGYSGNLAKEGSFFRRGNAGAWKEELSPAHVQQLLDRFAPLMERLGYAPGEIRSNFLCAS